MKDPSQLFERVKNEILTSATASEILHDLSMVVFPIDQHCDEFKTLITSLKQHFQKQDFYTVVQACYRLDTDILNTQILQSIDH